MLPLVENGRALTLLSGVPMVLTLMAALIDRGRNRYAANRGRLGEISRRYGVPGQTDPRKVGAALLATHPPRDSGMAAGPGDRARLDEDADGMIAPVDIGDRRISGCGIVMQIKDGEFVRGDPKKPGTSSWSKKNVQAVEPDLLAGRSLRAARGDAVRAESDGLDRVGVGDAGHPEPLPGHLREDSVARRAGGGRSPRRSPTRCVPTGTSVSSRSTSSSPASLASTCAWKRAAWPSDQ